MPQGQTHMIEEFDRYRARVRKARDTQSTDVIYNSSHEHAAVLIEELFSSARSDIGILCRDLNPDVYERPAVINAAQGFLEQEGAHLHILVQEPIVEDHAFLTQIRDCERYSDRVQIASAPAGVEAKFNFMVSDATAYRFESNRDSPTAFASFNGRNVAGQMASLIDELKPGDQLRTKGREDVTSGAVGDAPITVLEAVPA